MSPFRIVVAFAIAALAVYQGIARPGMRTVWFIVAGVAFVVGVIRLIKYLRTRTPGGSEPDALL